MKRFIAVMVVVLSMLVMFVGTVSAAPMASGTAILISVDYIPGKGPVFTFEASGNFSKSDLKGFAHVEGGADFDLNCTQVDSHTVKCTVSKKTAGKRVSLSWGGSTFWTHVPEAPAPASTIYCNNIYDWEPVASPTSWVAFDQYCSDEPSGYGDTLINWYNPSWGPSDYIFLPGSPSCFAADIIGDGYYYLGCPN
jgi:hypothetical protein